MPSLQESCSISCARALTIENQGDFSETFGVLLLVNVWQIDSIQVTLDSGENQILTFTWDTTGYSYNDYAIMAAATPVTGQTETIDNVLTGGSVLVTIAGDVDALTGGSVLVTIAGDVDVRAPNLHQCMKRTRYKFVVSTHGPPLLIHVK